MSPAAVTGKVDRRQRMGARAVSAGGAVLPARCDQIPTPAENQLYPYSGHSCAHRHPQASGRYSLRGVKSPKTGAVMSIIPLDLQRRCEQRWAARFSRPIPSAAPRNQRPERENLQVAAPAQIKRTTRRVESSRLETFTDGVSAGPKPRGPRVSMTVFLRVNIGQQLAMGASTGRQLISRCAELSHSEHPNEYAASF